MAEIKAKSQTDLPSGANLKPKPKDVKGEEQKISTKDQRLDFERRIQTILDEVISADAKYYALVIAKLKGAILRLEQLG